jgi:hypothetical protein
MSTGKHENEFANSIRSNGQQRPNKQRRNELYVE